MEILEGVDCPTATATVVTGLTVVLVTPDEIVRYGLSTMLDRVHGVGTVRTCTDLGEAARRFGVDDPDLMVVDASLAGGLPRLADELVRRRVKTLLLLGDYGEDSARLVAEVHADGFLCTDGLTRTGLAAALARVQQGEVTLPAEFARRMVAAASSREWSTGRDAVLTSREKQTLQLLGQGMSNKQIAHSLGISGHGAKRNVANVLAKLNCTNRTSAVARALRTGLLAEADPTHEIL